MSTTDVTIRIKGDAAAGVAAFDKTGKAAAAAMDRIKAANEGIQSSMENIKAMIGGLAVGFAGAAVLNGVRAQLDLADAMDESAQKAGIATSKLSELAYAGRFAGLEIDALVKALNKVTDATVKAASGDAAMRGLLVDTLGIDIRTAEGNIRSADQVLMDLVDTLSRVDDGSVRTAAAVRIFGDKLGPQLLPLINLTRKGVEDLTNEAQKMGVVISDEAGAAAGDLKDDLDRLRATQEGIYNQIMTAMLPGLNALAKMWLDNNAKAGVFLGTLKTIYQAVKEGLKDTFGFSEIDIAERNAKGAANKVRALAAEMERLQAIADKNPGAVVANGYGAPAILATERIKKLRQEYDAWSRAAVQASEKVKSLANARDGRGPKEVAAASDKAAIKGQDVLSALDRGAAAAPEKAARAAAAASRQAAAERTRQLNEERQRQRELYEDKVAGLRLELAQWRNNTEEQLRLAEQIAQAAKAQFGAESSEFSAAQQEIVRIRQRAADQQRAIQDEIAANQTQAALASIALEQQQADNAVAMGLMTQRERLALEQGFEDRMLEIKRKALEARLELMAKDPDLNPVERQRIYTQIEELERQHKARKGELDGARKAEDNQPLLNTFQSMEAAMADQTTRMIMGQQSAMQTLQGIYAQTATAFVQEMVTKPMAAWLAGEAQKTAATLLGVNTRTAAEATGAAMSTGITAATAIKTIGIKAYEAAASVYASISAIPIIGPFLAPAMAVGAIAAVGGFASKIFSAEGGFDIPAGVNPMVQAHAKEMILPAKYADVIRGLAANGGGGGGGSNVQISISALDARSVERWLRGDGGKAIVNELGLRQRSRRF